MVIEEARRIFAEQDGPSMQKAAEEALSDVFFCGSEEANTGFENAFYCFFEGVLTEVASKGSLSDTLERNLEHWTQSS